MNIFLLCFCLLATALTAHAKIEVLASGILYEDDVAAYGQLDGTDWYAITTSPTRIKKIKMQTTPDPENSIAPGVQIPDEANLLFYVRGVDLKEGVIPDGDTNIALTPEVSKLKNDDCGVYYRSSKIKTKEASAKDSELREIMVKCKGRRYRVDKFTLKSGDLPPGISWAGDLNGDGLPELKIWFDPWEKSAPNIIYFSEKAGKRYRYMNVGRLQFQGC